MRLMKYMTGWVLAGATLASTASGQSITLLNPSFEEPTTADGTATGTPPPGFGLFPGIGASGVFNTTDSRYTGTTGSGAVPGGDGIQVAYINNDTTNSNFLFQNLESEVIEPNEVYTLTVAVGNAFAQIDENFSIRLSTFTGVIIAETVGDPELLAAGRFTDITAVSTAFPDGFATTGLQIQLANLATKPGDTVQVNFDNVRLTSVVPEPASLGMIALGTLALAIRRRRN